MAGFRPIFPLMLCCLLIGVWQRSEAQFYYYGNVPSPTANSTWQLGVSAGYAMPRNEFAMEFDRAPSYEFFLQLRSKKGVGPFTSRLGFFYTNFTPRLDTFRTYSVETSNGVETVRPGFFIYKDLRTMGIFIEQAYAVVMAKGLRLDLGLGLSLGKYRFKYAADYSTVRISDAVIDDFMVGLRPKLGIGYQLTRHIELYGEYKYMMLTSTDWERQFPYNALGLGLIVTLNPAPKENGY